MSSSSSDVSWIPSVSLRIGGALLDRLCSFGVDVCGCGRLVDAAGVTHVEVAFFVVERVRSLHVLSVAVGEEEEVFACVEISPPPPRK